ncbi:MAG: DUF4011 domain-containing protein [Clostridia bacterium]|nr:DUF4011 domain-containing protein [Clostridia bacterium]
MGIEKINKWAELLLDTGKRNNLINFKDTKMGSVEVLLPDFDTLFSKAEHATSFEVYDPKLSADDDDVIEETEVYDELFAVVDGEEDKKTSADDPIAKAEYIRLHEPRLKKKGKLLLYNSAYNPIKALHNVGRKAKTVLEETGVNTAYMAFGFINWTEEKTAQKPYRAPILLIPISIVNESAIAPYYIKVMDSEIIVNPTFSFKLKNDYGITLPEYDDESIEEYLQKLEQVIYRLGWDITRECKIGIFSFQKINMYNDLRDNAPKIMQNPSVSALLGEPTLYTEGEQTAPKACGDEPVQLFNVVDADSSQTDAITLAHSGQSFVLQGPPGTGKSQTITNIIAQCLADGKKVLFVSEKMAALNVVYDKLKKAGLEEFCLELHSHKANKKGIIAELCHTLKAPKSAVSGRAQRETEAKARAKADLDEYTTELHRVRPVINKSLYALYEELSACRTAPTLDFVISNVQSKGEDFINNAQAAINSYVEYIPSIGDDYRQNVWYGYNDVEYSYQSVTQLKEDLCGAVELCQRLKAVSGDLGKYTIGAKSLNEFFALKEFFNLAHKSPYITPALLKAETNLSVTKFVSSMKILADEIIKNKQILDRDFDEDVYKINGKNIHKKLTKEFTGAITRLFSGEYKSIIKQLKLCSKEGKKLKYQQAVLVVDTLRVYQQKYVEFNALEAQIVANFGGGYKGINTDFDRLLSELEALTNIIKVVDLGALSGYTKQDFLANVGNFEQVASAFNVAFGDFGQAEAHLAEKFDKAQFDVRTAEISQLIEKYEGCIDSIDNVDNWREFIKLLSRLEALDIKEFINYTIEQNISKQFILPAFKKLFYTQWIDVALHQSPILIRLSRIPHDETVNLFKVKDELDFEINKAKIKEKLSAQRPNLDMIAQGSAISVLLREGEKKRKQKGIRVLLEEITELVQTLKPCFLMSPLSVSTFLSADVNFDTVVFDEASQIFPQDAIGAIYRGKQVIVVGDSKQMPPSNFFNSTVTQDDSDDMEDDVTDFESILDICSTAFPQKRLKWHYRSRFEQLIAFSNKNFYENDLVTFPSAKKEGEGVGVDYFYVDGTFDRRTKTNRAEAEKIVDLVFENIEKFPERSLGVVAFSISQQNLIDKLIAKRRKQDPSKEFFFKSDNQEPFFVKNLETVQGDERDVIIFSIAYGKDQDGRLLLNFGPVNRDGGERRLNVAVTRAKYNVQLVSSMHYTDIDLTRTQSVGARLLREYLDYAENGQIALARTASVNPFEEDVLEFETEVYEFLYGQGFDVERNLGTSAFKIDLAVKHPETGDYLLAVECDGTSYRMAKSTRDRDRLRQAILERMGWRYYRIWSTDWFKNKPLEKQRLLDALRIAYQNKGGGKVTEDRQCGQVSFEEVATVEHFDFPKYLKANEVRTSERYFYDKTKTIFAIAQLEAPISEEWLLKRVLFLFGRDKVTSAVRTEYNRILATCTNYKIERKDGFLYVRGKQIPMLRVPAEDSATFREVKQIALEELALGMLEVLKQNVSVEKLGMFRLISQRLGFTRVSEAVSDRLEEALKLILDKVDNACETLTLKQ